MIVYTIIGFDSGIMIFPKIVASEAPSKRAASLSETGMVSKKPFNTKNPSPEPAEYTITRPASESVSPIIFRTK